MSISEFAARSYQVKYWRCYISPRLTSGVYGSWVDVTRYVTTANLGRYRRSIDSDDFDIGYYEESNVTIGFDNQCGDFMENRGFFEGAIIDRSRIRIIAGYRDPEAPSDLSRASYEVDFEGIIDDRGTSIDSNQENARFTVLSYSSIINRLRTDPGAVGTGQDFKTAFFNLLNRSEINQLLTVDLNNINPKLNLPIDVPSFFAGKQLKQSISSLLLASNSVLKITNNTIYVVPRTQSPTVRFQFFGKGSKRPCNIISLTNWHTGLRRAITRIRLNELEWDASTEILDLYGSNLKTIDLGMMTDEDVIQAIAEDIIAEFQYPKAEFELTTDYLGNEIDILDMVTVENEGTITSDSPPIYGKAVYGQSNYTERVGGVKLRLIEGYKVLSISHNYQNYTTTIKLRAIGNRPFDSNAGYSNPIYGQAIYGLSRYAVIA